MITPTEFIRQWNEPLSRLGPLLAQRQLGELPQETLAFLAEAGLPLECAPYLSFNVSEGLKYVYDVYNCTESRLLLVLRDQRFRFESMITSTQILRVCDEIVRQFSPERIILFGSYAYGTPTEDSDVDLLVVLPFEGRKAKKATEIRIAVYAGFPMDLIPITPERLKHRIEIEDFFLREVVEKGRVLYETNHRAMD